jgi:hypothetical protein
VDIRIAQLDAERTRLLDQKSKLSTLLTEFSKPSALDHLRKTILEGHKFVPLKMVPKPKIPKAPGP